MRTVLLCKATGTKSLRSFIVVDEATGLEIQNIFRISTRRQQEPDVISYPFKLSNEPLEMVIEYGDRTEEVVHYKKGVAR